MCYFQNGALSHIALSVSKMSMKLGAGQSRRPHAFCLSPTQVTELQFNSTQTCFIFYNCPAPLSWRTEFINRRPAIPTLKFSILVEESRRPILKVMVQVCVLAVPSFCKAERHTESYVTGSPGYSTLKRDSEEGSPPSQVRQSKLDSAHMEGLLPAKRTCLVEQILLWQRNINSDGNCDVETSRDVNANINKIQQDEAQLTRRNLALFNKMTTGEVPGDESESTLPEFTTQTTTIKSKSASATMSSFANKGYKNGILPPYNSKPPTNLDERYEQAVKSRETASPTVAEYGSYLRTLQGHSTN